MATIKNHQSDPKKKPISKPSKTKAIDESTADDFPIVGIGASAGGLEALEAGCNDYISKPINMIQLHEFIKKHFNKQKINPLL